MLNNEIEIQILNPLAINDFSTKEVIRKVLNPEIYLFILDMKQQYYPIYIVKNTKLQMCVERINILEKMNELKILRNGKACIFCKNCNLKHLYQCKHKNDYVPLEVLENHHCEHFIILDNNDLKEELE